MRARGLATAKIVENKMVCPNHRFALNIRRIDVVARIVGLAALFASLLLSVPAMAGTSTATLTVQINITAACSIDVSTLDFGSNAGTALLGGNLNATTSVSVTCTSGSPYSIGVNNGSNASSGQRRMINGANYISYNLYTDSGHANAWTTASNSTTCTTSNSCLLGTGNGSAQLTSIYGVVPSVATAPAAGNYSDSVTMTVTY